MRQTAACCLAIAAATLALANPVAGQARPAAEKPATKSRSLDQQLLDDLDRELLKGLPRATKTPEPARGTSEKDTVPPSGADKMPNSGNAAGDSQNPLGNIAQRMRSVEGRIAQHDTSTATQAEQAKILAELDALLAAANQNKQQRGKSGGAAQSGVGTGTTPAGPPRDSTDRIDRGTKEQVETADVKDILRRFWGHLPDKDRAEMQQALSEQFLPKYERLIEKYYKRLAEERPGGP
jgi:hypothetical protein